MSFFVRFFAGLLIALGFTVFGIFESDKLKKKQNISEEAYSDVLRLKEEIVLFKTPVSDAVKSVSLNGGELFKRISDELLKGKSVTNASKTVCNKMFFEKRITENEKNLINGLFLKLGGGNVSEESVIIEDFLNRFNKEKTEIETNFQKNSKLIKIIWGAAGTVISVMLI